MEYRTFFPAGQAGHSDLTRDTIARALNGRGPRPHPRSDAETSSRLAQSRDGELPPPAATPVPAAVLVPLVRRDDGLTVLLTQRTAHLAHHPGQISFPGGRQEEADADPVAAALRETEEEIGLPPGAIDILGRLDDYVTVTNFRIVPVVGMITPPFTLAPDSFEVKDVFEVPLSFILDPVNHQRHSRDTPSGEKRFFYAMPYQDRYIWGATAAILVNLYEALCDRCAS